MFKKPKQEIRNVSIPLNHKHYQSSKNFLINFNYETNDNFCFPLYANLQIQHLHMLQIHKLKKPNER